MADPSETMMPHRIELAQRVQEAVCGIVGQMLDGETISTWDYVVNEALEALADDLAEVIESAKQSEGDLIVRRLPGKKAMSVPAIETNPHADFHFYKAGLHYYAAGRFAVAASLMPVNCNLFHHAVEMILKGKLTHTHSLKKLWNKFSHDLPKIWRKFKEFYPNEGLNEFDGLIEHLHRFEDLRYPDSLLKDGAHIVVGFGKGDLSAGQNPLPGQPVYQLSVTELDALVAKLISIIGVRLQPHFDPNGPAAEYLQMNNHSSKGWFPDRPKGKE